MSSVSPGGPQATGENGHKSKKKKNFTESFSVFKSQLLLKGNMLPVVQKNALLMKLYIKRTMIRFHSILSSV